MGLINGKINFRKAFEYHTYLMYPVSRINITTFYFSVVGRSFVHIINIQNKIYEGIFLDKKKINKYPRYIFLSKKYKPQIKEIKNFDLLNHTIKYFLN